MLRIKVPEITKEIVIRASSDSWNETFRYIDRNRDLLQNIQKSRENSAQREFNSKLISDVLADLTAATIVAFVAINSITQKYEFIPFISGSVGLVSTFRLKKVIENKYGKSSGELADQHVSRIESDYLKSRNTCLGCHYYNENPYLRCTNQPTLVDTPEAVNCLDYHSKI
jgi:hypothetical protein